MVTCSAGKNQDRFRLRHVSCSRRVQAACSSRQQDRHSEPVSDCVITCRVMSPLCLKLLQPFSCLRTSHRAPHSVPSRSFHVHPANRCFTHFSSWKQASELILTLRSLQTPRAKYFPPPVGGWNVNGLSDTGVLPAAGVRRWPVLCHLFVLFGFYVIIC